MNGTAAVFSLTIAAVCILACGCTFAPGNAPPAPTMHPTQGGRMLLTIGVDNAYPPFTYQDHGGNLTGLDIEAARWIASRQGFDVEFASIPWDGILPALLAGKIDMIYSGLTITPERQRNVSFTTPYYSVNQSVAVRLRSNATMQDLYEGRLRVGAQLGSTGAAWIEENLVRPGKMPAADLVLYPDISVLTLNLANGTIDASIVHTPAQNRAIAGQNLRIMGEIPTHEQYAIAVRKSDPRILTMMDDGLGELMKDPYWQQLLLKYGLDNATLIQSQPSATPAAPGAAGPRGSPGNCSFDQLLADAVQDTMPGESCYFNTHSPADFLDDLQAHPKEPVMVLTVPAGWITKRDAEELMQSIDSDEPAAPVLSPISSYWPQNQTSTVGNEALFLLEGYRSARYPPALCSLYYFKGNASEVREWWKAGGITKPIDERTAIQLVQRGNPALASYPSDQFPVHTIKTERVQEGWYVAFLQEGSGVPITCAQCYLVGDDRLVRQTGAVNHSIMVMPSDFSAKKCG